MALVNEFNERLLKMIDEIAKDEADFNSRYIPIEWLRNKEDELRKEYYDSFYSYTDEGMNKQVRLNDDFRAFHTVLRYWEKENES